MQALLEAGAAVDSKNKDAMPALMVAAQYGQVGAMRVLLEAGAAVDSKSNDAMTALMVAACEGEAEAMRVLLAAGAEVDLKNNHGQTALLVAAKCGQAAAVRLLLGAGAAANAPGQSGVTALAAVIGCGSLDVARVLLEAGAELPLPGQSLGPDEVPMRQLLDLHRGARVAEAGRADREAAEAAAAVLMAEAAAAAADAADALLAEEEADKSSAASRQAKAKRKKQRQKTKRAEAAPAPAHAEGGARSGPAPSGADPPCQCSGSQASCARSVATGLEEGQITDAEEGPEWASRDGEGGVLAGALQASDGADERGGEEEEERGAANPDPLPVVTIPAEEVLCALEAAGSDGEVGEGGFGKVVAAQLPSLAARWGRVAVKSASGLQAADILLEVATLGLCSHHNVLRLLGYCDDARAPCMITPLMHGGSLDDRLLLSGGALERLRRLGFEGDAHLGWQRRLSALCDAARGLAHLHCERILHRDVKTANILLEGALWPLPMAHGPPLLVYRAVLGDVGLAKVREPTLGGTTHATTHNLAFSTGFGDPALLNSNQHSERTDTFGIGVCILMGLVSEPAAGLMNDHEDDVCEAMEDGTGLLFGAAYTAAGRPSDATRALAALVHGLSIATKRRRLPLPEALVLMEALLGAVGEATGGEVARAQPAPAKVGAAFALPRPLVSPGGASLPPVREDEPGARAAASAQPEGWSGGELTRMVRRLELGDADARSLGSANA